MFFSGRAVQDLILPVIVVKMKDLMRMLLVLHHMLRSDPLLNGPARRRAMLEIAVVVGAGDLLLYVLARLRCYFDRSMKASMK